MLLSGQTKVVGAAVTLRREGGDCQLSALKQIFEIAFMGEIWHEIWLAAQHTMFVV